jgi:hypothetical protein
MASAPDGSVYLWRGSPSTLGTGSVDQLKPDGVLESVAALPAGLHIDYTALAVDPAGRIIVGMTRAEFDWTRMLGEHHYLFRLTAPGAPDPAFNVGTGPWGAMLSMVRGRIVAPTTTIIPAPDGSVLVAGSFSRFDDRPAFGLVRILPDAAPVATPSRLVNLSARSEAAGLITGFIIGGTERKSVLLRAVGPGLAAFGVTNAAENPTLTLYRSGAPASVADNDNWNAQGLPRPGVPLFPRDAGFNVATTGQRVGAFLLAADAEAAFTASLEPGAYTAVVGSSPGMANSGTVLVEVYDANMFPGDRRLRNVAARGFAGSGDRSLVAGFAIRGTTPMTVLIRGVGPTLAAFGVDDALADPRLELFAAGGGTPISTNEDWSSATNASGIAAASASVGAFPLASDSRDAALLVTLSPGDYTLHVSGATNGSGTALAEVYEVTNAFF